MGTHFKGKIRLFHADKGFGFITCPDGTDIHFRRDVVSGGTPAEGVAVEGDWVKVDKGPRATAVRILQAAAAPAVIVARPSAPPPAPITIAPAKPYYADSDKKQLRPELLVEEAEAAAKELAAEKLNGAQVRRFFEEVRRAARIVETKGFEAAQPLVRLLAAKAHYAYGREKIGRAFLSYISSNAKAIQDRKDFDAFVKSFEAVASYFAYHTSLRKS